MTANTDTLMYIDFWWISWATVSWLSNTITLDRDFSRELEILYQEELKLKQKKDKKIRMKSFYDKLLNW